MGHPTRRRSARRPRPRSSVLCVALGVALLACGCGGGEAPARPVEAAASGSDSAAALSSAGAGARAEPAAPPQEIVRAPEMDGDVVLIDVAEVREKLVRGDPLVLIDTRKRFEFDQEHVPGAISIPLQTISTAGELPGIPREQEIIVYCLAETCPSSRNAARVLAGFGYANVRDMRAGLMGWKQAGFDTVRRGKSPRRQGG